MRLLTTLAAVEVASRVSIRRNSLDSGGAYALKGRIVGKPEVALAADLFDAQVVSALHLSSDYQKLILLLPEKPQEGHLKRRAYARCEIGLTQPSLRPQRRSPSRFQFANPDVAVADRVIVIL